MALRWSIINNMSNILHETSKFLKMIYFSSVIRNYWFVVSAFRRFLGFTFNWSIYFELFIFIWCVFIYLHPCLWARWYCSGSIIIFWKLSKFGWSWAKPKWSSSVVRFVVVVYIPVIWTDGIFKRSLIYFFVNVIKMSFDLSSFIRVSTYLFRFDGNKRGER